MEFTVANSTKKVKELITILEPYAAMWQEWTESGACFLSKQEIKILQNYLLSGSCSSSCVEFNISEIIVTDILDQIQVRLRWGSYKFESWLTERLLEEHGIITYTSPQDRFLNSPLMFLSIPDDLKFRLRYLLKYTMADILTSYTEAKLKAHWSVNDKLLKDFKEVLHQNKCLHLLK